MCCTASKSKQNTISYNNVSKMNILQAEPNSDRAAVSAFKLHKIISVDFAFSHRNFTAIRADQI